MYISVRFRQYNLATNYRLKPGNGTALKVSILVDLIDIVTVGMRVRVSGSGFRIPVQKKVNSGSCLNNQIQNSFKLVLFSEYLLIKGIMKY